MSAAMETQHSESPKTGAGAGNAELMVHVNGEPRRTAAATLAGLVEEAGYGTSRVATALNGEFVPQRSRAATLLKPGDHVEVVAPRQGG